MKTIIIILAIFIGVCITSIDSSCTTNINLSKSPLKELKLLKNDKSSDISPFNTNDRQKRHNIFNIIIADSTVSSGSADVLSSIFNLSKTILGAGILSLPAAVAAFSDQVILFINILQ